MFIREARPLPTRKELKVHLPPHQHRRLQAMQVETGLEMPALVSQALDLYFAKLARTPRAPGR